MPTYTLVEGPGVEPLEVGEVRGHLRIEHSEDDLWLRAAIVAVRQRMEVFLGRALITQTWEAAWAAWPGEEMELRPAPLQAVTWLRYYGADGSESTVGGYVVDTRPRVGRVVLRSGSSWPWPAGGLATANGVVARYVVGYGARAKDVPQFLRSVMLLWVGDLYENRESVLTGSIATKLPTGMEGALWGWRVF